MKQPNSSFFHAGKAARQAGKNCMNNDARISQQNRADWYTGWNFQDSLMRGQPDAELIEQNENFLADLRAELRGTRA